MADSLRIDMPDLADFARDLKAAPKELQRELYRELNSVTKDVRDALRQSALEKLPSSGGLADRVSRAIIRGTIRRGNQFGVSISIRAPRNEPFSAAGLDRGEIRWRKRPPQGVSAGWISEPWEDYADKAVAAMQEVVKRVATKIRRG